MIFDTSNNGSFKGKAEAFRVLRLLLEFMLDIPPDGYQYVQCSGLYASHITGKWLDEPRVVRLVLAEWKTELLKAVQGM